MSNLIVGVNDLETLSPDLVLDWDLDLNDKLPSELTENSRYYVNWKCHVCGNRWRSRLDSRTSNMHGCPQCSRSKGSSICDRLLYMLFKLSYPEPDNVFYRYNVLPGCEADIFISPNIIVEYDGYYFHSTSEKKSKDLKKKNLWQENNYQVYIIKERNDRDLSISFVNDIVYVPEFIKENFEFLKNSFVDIFIKLGLLNNISEDYYSLSLEDVEASIRRPIYEKSLQYYLDKDSCSLQLNRSGLDARNIYASSTTSLDFKCSNGHTFKMRADHVRRGYGCPICSGRRVKEFSIKERYYNISYSFPEISKVGDNLSVEGMLSRRWVFKCPFCGKEQERNLASTIRLELGDFCDCTKMYELAYVIILGKDIDGRVYYVVNLENLYFLCICEDNSFDYILSQVCKETEDFEHLDVSLFTKYLGDPFIKTTMWNKVSSLPFNKSNLQFSRISCSDLDSLYLKMRKQLEKGNKKEYCDIDETILITKSMLVERLSVSLDGYYKEHFAYNATVDGIPTALASRKLGLLLDIKVNLCNKRWLNKLRNNIAYGLDKRLVVVTSYKEFKGIDNVVVIPSVVKKSDLEKSISIIFENIVNMFDNILKNRNG